MSLRDNPGSKSESERCTLMSVSGHLQTYLTDVLNVGFWVTLDIYEVGAHVRFVLKADKF